MFDVDCHHCDRAYLVGTRSIVSSYNTSGGPIAYVRCPHNHLLIRNLPHHHTAPAVRREEPAFGGTTLSADDLCGAVR